MKPRCKGQNKGACWQQAYLVALRDEHGVELLFLVLLGRQPPLLLLLRPPAGPPPSAPLALLLLALLLVLVLLPVRPRRLHGDRTVVLQRFQRQIIHVHPYRAPPVGLVARRVPDVVKRVVFGDGPQAVVRPQVLLRLHHVEDAVQPRAAQRQHLQV